MVKKKILLFGDSGKIGSAFKEVFIQDYILVCKNSQNINIENVEEVEEIIKYEQPDIIVNAIIYGGVNQCEEDPYTALYINTLFPKLLAQCSSKIDCVLIHFSSEAVFTDNIEQELDEDFPPAPVNMYGYTKYGADIYVAQKAKRYYIFRIPIQFGVNKKNEQFVEKMLQKALSGQKEFNIVDDIVSVPVYNIDTVFKVKEIIENNLEYGLYHITSNEKATLYELFCAVINEMNLDVKIEKASYKDFPLKAQSNTFVKMKSKKINFIRGYKESIKDYCNNIKRNDNGR